MSSPTYMTSIQVDVFQPWKRDTSKHHYRQANRTKVYYDLVELTPDQIKAIVKMTGILSRGIYECHLPEPLENQVTGNLNDSFNQ